MSHGCEREPDCNDGNGCSKVSFSKFQVVGYIPASKFVCLCVCVLGLAIIHD